LLASCLEGYDSEAALFDPPVRDAQRATLLHDASEAVRPAFATLLAQGRARGMGAAKAALGAWTGEGGVSFARAVEEGETSALNELTAAVEAAQPPMLAQAWAPAAAAARRRLQRDWAAHAAHARSTGLAARAETVTIAALRRVGPAAAALLDAPTAGLWRSLRHLLSEEGQRSASALADACESFGPPPIDTPSGSGEEEGEDSAQPMDLDAPPPSAEQELLSMSADCAAKLRALVEDKCAEAAVGAGARLKERFGRVFGFDEKGLPRLWRPTDDIDAAASAAKAAAAETLALLSILRLEETEGGAEEAACVSIRAQAGAAAVTEDSPLLSAAWPGLTASQQLLSPPAVRNAWRSFDTDCGFAVLQARTAQEAARRAQAAGAPLWAILMIVILGWNELMWLLRSPLTLITLACVFLFGRALYAKMEVESTVATLGLVPSLAILASRLVPAAVAVFSKLLEAGQAAHGATAPAAVLAEPRRESVGMDHTAAAAEEREKLAALRRRTAAAAAAEARAESQGSSNGKDD